MAGDLELCEQLEADLALLVGTEAALVFGSGFLANLGVLTAAAGRGDEVFADRLNHASLTDGMQLSGARWRRYRHKDAGHLASLLAKCAADGGGAGRRVVVSDSIFSMDGDRAPLDELAEVAARHGAMLVVDEAHAIGVMGAGGGGICREGGCKARPDFVVGTLSKSLGGYGGFVGCSSALRELLINRARSFIYSTGLPPGCIGAARAALAVLAAEPQMGGQLLAKARLLRDLLAAGHLAVGATESQILPVHVGGNAEAVRLSQLLWDRGVLATAVRPPTVPAGTARLRLSVTLAHTEDELAAAAAAIIDAAREVGLV
jgi:8-amino-7-oxononanoate synthase